MVRQICKVGSLLVLGATLFVTSGCGGGAMSEFPPVLPSTSEMEGEVGGMTGEETAAQVDDMPGEEVRGPASVMFESALPFPITDIMGGAPARVDFGPEGYWESRGQVALSGAGRDLTPDDVQHGPISLSARWHEDGYEEPLIFVGVDQATNENWGFLDGVQLTRESVADLPVLSVRSDVVVRYGRIEDGAGAETLNAYFDEVLTEAAEKYLVDPGLQNRALRYETPPVVHLIGHPEPLDVQETIAALQLVNASLPEAARLRMGETLWGVSFPQDAEGRASWPLENVIAIDFHDAHDAFEEDGNRTPGTTHADNEFRSDGNIRWSYIRVGREVAGPDHPVRQDLIGSVIHELLHALGVYGHVAPFSFRSQVNSFGSDAHLWPIDREGLRVLYDRLQPGDALPFDFGSWESDSLHIHGNGPFAGFGVALRNGYAEPWAYGDWPDGFLSDNPRLSGSVTWRGALLGLTPDAAAVLGDATILVDMEQMTGRTEFTRLESWDAAPGAAGTGETWGSGVLGYDIAVRRNTFRETGGDDGRLTGAFTGIAHGGVAGILERADLTAAFGGNRFQGSTDPLGGVRN